MDIGVGMGMIFGNGYGCQHGPNLPHTHPIASNVDLKSFLWVDLVPFIDLVFLAKEAWPNFFPLDFHPVFGKFL